MVLAEALDRLSRDQADVATLSKHLRFAGVPIVTLSEGEISELHGLKGTMNALFLKDLAAKTHRGLRGRVEKGKSGGGLCYGYDVVKHFNAGGEPIRGDRTINPAEAEIIRRVFHEFGTGTEAVRTAARSPAKCWKPGCWTDSATASWRRSSPPRPCAPMQEETNRLNRDRRSSGDANRRELEKLARSMKEILTLIEDGGGQSRHGDSPARA